MCHFWELSCKAGEAVSDAVDNIIAQWAQAVLQGVSDTLITVGSTWVGVQVPDLTASGSAVGFIHSSTRLLVIAVAIASLMVAGIHLAFSRRGEGALNILQGLLTLAVVSSVSVGAGQMLVEASDEFSIWIISLVAAQDTGQFASKILSVSSLTGAVGMVVIIIGGLAALIANMLQIGLMFVRSAMLILLVGVMPLAGAAYFTKWGRGWLWKMVAWFFAFLLYKPAASIIYALAIKLVSGGHWTVFTEDDLTGFITGVIMLGLAVMSLPALITFMVPATEAISSGGGGAAAGAGAVLATGAMTVARVGGAAASGGTSELVAAGAGAASAAHGATTSAVEGSAGGSAGGGVTSLGAQGSAGSAGANGSDGSAGSAGATGAVGMSGGEGAPGASGQDGASGASGAQGVAGVDGQTPPAMGSRGGPGASGEGPSGGQEVRS
ncbi:MAG: hypothetical protein Q4D87_05745 [Actinomycetaceae bacterium]|nr:hypothetical protein [Actinomycetaceae bacterium]